VRYFYGAAHEQFKPSELLRHAQLAEAAGFDGVYCSDHFQPWWEPGGLKPQHGYDATGRDVAIARRILTLLVSAGNRASP
jgi:alkanesulfonate monooxygenase SsuD/methylene tetrahydromethanopterin reductase-like flavin-dependent oxidoreductase (luciferase family)